MDDTATKPVTEAIDHLDFTPQCCVDESTRQGERGNPCSHPAVWIGYPPCGHEGYFCEGHHSDQRLFRCYECGTDNQMLATYRWVRL